jgi:hypothetical protein
MGKAHYIDLSLQEHLLDCDTPYGVCMSFNETSDAEITELNKHFPNRSPEEVKQAIENAKSSFHGSRRGTRAEILSQMLT